MNEIPYADEIIAIQNQLFEKNGTRTDVHVSEGQGVLFINENAPLLPQFVILQIPYHVFVFGMQINIQ